MRHTASSPCAVPPATSHPSTPTPFCVLPSSAYAALARLCCPLSLYAQGQVQCWNMAKAAGLQVRPRISRAGATGVHRCPPLEAFRVERQGGGLGWVMTALPKSFLFCSKHCNLARSPFSWLTRCCSKYHLLLKPKDIVGDTVSDVSKGCRHRAKRWKGWNGMQVGSERPNRG